MSECTVLEWSSANLTPAPLDRRQPGDVDWLEGDISLDVDCAGTGVTLSSAVPSIPAEYDDGGLTFGAVQLTGATFRVPYTVGSDETQRMYPIQVLCTTSDQRTLRYWYSLPVIPTCIPYA